MFHRLWLLFAQVVTVLLAAWLVFASIKPSLFGGTQINPFVAKVSIGESLNDGRLSPGSYHEAVKHSMPAVVNIFTSKAGSPTGPKRSKNPNPADPFFNFFFGEKSPQEDPRSNLGSGVLVSPEGIILTNHHVISDADDIDITLADGRNFKAKLIGSDPETDIAVLKIESKNLPDPITFGQIESVHVGDVVLAIGNPFGVGLTVTSGIVSALGRDQVGINTFENFIQTDAAINPGNSGGALIDTRGNLIGINTAIYSNNGGSMGIGFAIPVNLAKQVMESIIKNGSVTRGWIGVEPKNISKELAQSLNLPSDTTGVLIAGVLEGGPADQGGIRPGDILVHINNQNIRDVRQLLNQVAQKQPGEEIIIEILRKNKKIRIPVRISKRPAR